VPRSGEDHSCSTHRALVSAQSARRARQPLSAKLALERERVGRQPKHRWQRRQSLQATKSPTPSGAPAS